jgi:hypothetical protein
MMSSERGSPKSPCPKRLPDKLIRFWSQPHNSGSTATFNESIRSSPSNKSASVTSCDESIGSAPDDSLDRAENLTSDSRSVIMKDTSESVDSINSISRMFLSELDLTTVAQLKRRFSSNSTQKTESRAAHSAETPDPQKKVGVVDSENSRSCDDAKSHASPSLSQVIRVWNSPHMSGTTVSFNKGSSVGSHDTSTSLNDSRHAMRARVLFDESTDQSRDNSGASDSFDPCETSNSFDHSRTTNSYEQSRSSFRDDVSGTTDSNKQSESTSSKVSVEHSRASSNRRSISTSGSINSNRSQCSASSNGRSISMSGCINSSRSLSVADMGCFHDHTASLENSRSVSTADNSRLSDICERSHPSSSSNLTRSISSAEDSRMDGVSERSHTSGSDRLSRSGSSRGDSRQTDSSAQSRAFDSSKLNPSVSSRGADHISISEASDDATRQETSQSTCNTASGRSRNSSVGSQNSTSDVQSKSSSSHTLHRTTCRLESSRSRDQSCTIGTNGCSRSMESRECRRSLHENSQCSIASSISRFGNMSRGHTSDTGGRTQNAETSPASKNTSRCESETHPPSSHNCDRSSVSSPLRRSFGVEKPSANMGGHTFGQERPDNSNSDSSLPSLPIAREMQSGEMNGSPSVTQNNEIEMDLSAYAKLQRVFAGKSPCASPTTSSLKSASDDSTSLKLHQSAKSDPALHATNRDILQSDSSPQSKNRTVSSLLINDATITPTASFILSKTPGHSKHVTFPDEVIVDCRELAVSICDSSRSADSSSDPSRYENSSLMMSNSILDSSSYADSTLATSIQSTGSRSVKSTAKSINADACHESQSSFPVRGILKNSSYNKKASHADASHSSLPNHLGASMNEMSVDSTRQHSAFLAEGDTAVGQSRDDGKAGDLSPQSDSENANDNGCFLVDVPAIECRNTAANVTTNRPATSADVSASLSQDVNHKLSGKTPSNNNNDSHSSFDPSARDLNLESSADSAYLTPQPCQVYSSDRAAVASTTFPLLISTQYAVQSCSMETGQESFDIAGRPFSPEALPPPDDLDLTSIRSEGSDGAYIENRHHLVSFDSTGEQKLNVSALFGVAVVESDDDMQRQNTSFDFGINNRSNDTERMLVNVINAAQQAVSNGQTEPYNQVTSHHNESIRSLSRHIGAQSPIPSGNGDDDGTYVHTNIETSPLGSNDQPDGTRWNRTSPQMTKGLLSSIQIEDSDFEPSDMQGHIPSPIGNLNQSRRKLASPQVPGKARFGTLNTDEINESFELSSVSTLGNDSDKEEGQIHFWIDAFLDFVSPTEDERSMNSEDSTSTVSESLPCTSHNTKPLGNANRKVTKSKSRKRSMSSVARLKEWWKKELIAEVMRDSAKKADREGKADDRETKCPNVERLVSKEFKKVLSGERIELLGSKDSGDDALLQPRGRAEIKDELPKDWMESFKKTIVCGTADTLKESYKSIQNKVESFDTLDGLVQALKKSKFDSDANELSGSFKSMYQQLQKGIVEASMFDRENGAEPAYSKIPSRCVEESVGDSRIEEPDENCAVNAPPDDSLELFMKEESRLCPSAASPTVPACDNGQKASLPGRIFETPENSLIEQSLNDTRSSICALPDSNLVAEIVKKRVRDSEQKGDACADNDLFRDDCVAKLKNGDGSEATVDSKIFGALQLSGADQPSLNDDEISMSDFDQRKPHSESSEGSAMCRSITHHLSSCDISLASGLLSDAADVQKEGSLNEARFNQWKPSPDKQNLTKDTVQDISEESMNLTKFDFIQVSKIKEPRPEADLSAVIEPAVVRTKKRRSPKIHITTLSQPTAESDGFSSQKESTSKSSTLFGVSPAATTVAGLADTSESNLTQFGEECGLFTTTSTATSAGPDFESSLLLDTPGNHVALDACQDDEFARLPQAAASVASDLEHTTRAGKSATSSASRSYGHQNEQEHVAAREVSVGKSGCTTTKATQRIGSIPLLKRRLGRRKSSTNAENRDRGSKESREMKPDPPGPADRCLTETKSELTKPDAKVNARALGVTVATLDMGPVVESKARPSVSSFLQNVDIPLHHSDPAHKTQTHDGKRSSNNMDDMSELVSFDDSHRTTLDPSVLAAVSWSARSSDDADLVAPAPRHNPHEVQSVEAQCEPLAQCSPDGSSREWENFSLNDFAASGFNSTLDVEKERISISISAMEQQAEDMYTTSESEFVSFDQNVYAEPVLQYTSA